MGSIYRDTNISIQSKKTLAIMPAKQFKSERAVYFNGLPKHVIREEVYKWACSLGWVRKLDLPDGYGNYHNKGYAYIHFKKEKDASNVIAKKRLYWKGHNISVSAYVETRSEEDRIPYKDRRTYKMHQDHASEDIMMMLGIKNASKNFDKVSETDSAIRSRASTSLSSIESWPTLKKAAANDESIVKFSKQESTQTIVPDNDWCMTSDCESIQSYTHDESLSQISDQQVQVSEHLVIPQTEISTSTDNENSKWHTFLLFSIYNFMTKAGVSNNRTSTQQMISVNGVYLDVDTVSMMYNILADEMQKLNLYNGSNLSITTHPDLVDLFFKEITRVISGNEAVQIC